MFRATPVNGPFYRGVRNTDIRARPEHLQGGYRLSSRIRIFAFFLGWFHTHVVVNLQQLLLYLLIFLVFLQFMLGIAGASHLPIYRAQPELGNGSVGVQLQSMLQSGVRGEKGEPCTIQSI